MYYDCMRLLSREQYLYMMPIGNYSGEPTKYTQYTKLEIISFQYCLNTGDQIYFKTHKCHQYLEKLALFIITKSFNTIRQKGSHLLINFYQ